MALTNAFGQLLPVEPPANTMTPCCRLCSFIGPSHRTGTDLHEVLVLLVEHVREQHPDAVLETAHPKMVYGYVAGLTDDMLTRVNARRAEAPYNEGRQCTEPGCPCDG